MIKLSEEYVGIKFSVECLGSLDLSAPSLHLLATELLMETKRLPRGAILEMAGNVSLRSPEGFIISGSGTDLCDLWYHHLVRVIVHSQIKENACIQYYGDRLPSSETNLHWQIYQKRKDINGIVHLHPPNLSYLQSNPQIPRTSHYVPYGSIELAEMAAKALETINTVVLVDHGTVSIASTFKKAVDETLTLILNNK